MHVFWLILQLFFFVNDSVDDGVGWSECRLSDSIIVCLNIVEYIVTIYYLFIYFNHYGQYIYCYKLQYSFDQF